MFLPALFTSCALCLHTWCPAGVVGLDNFNDYYPVSIKRARQANAETAGVYTVDGDLNDAALLRQLFDECPFTHVLHLAAQVERDGLTNTGVLLVDPSLEELRNAMGGG